MLRDSNPIHVFTMAYKSGVLYRTERRLVYVQMLSIPEQVLDYCKGELLFRSCIGLCVKKAVNCEQIWGTALLCKLHNPALKNLVLLTDILP